MPHILSIISILILISLSTQFILSQNPTPNAFYDVTLSAKYASYAAIAFCPKNCVQSWTCGTTSKYPKLINVTYIQNSITKAVCYIGYDPTTQTIITSWRGSNNAQNWIQDFNFQMEPYFHCTDCFIHTGFIQDYRLNQKKLLEAAQAIVKEYKVSKILCTGHSLGAALSLINGIQFVHKFTNIPVQVHNFGSPRIGNQKLALYLKQKIPTIFRVVHNKDIVPHLPPQGEYKHPAYEVFWNKDMSVHRICSQSGQDKSCSNQYFPNYDPNDHDYYFVYISQTKCC